VGDDLVTLTVPLNERQATVLRFKREIYQRHMAAARRAGLELQDYLAGKVITCDVVDGPLIESGAGAGQPCNSEESAAERWAGNRPPRWVQGELALPGASSRRV
jgi:hypothetical protein